MLTAKSKYKSCKLEHGRWGLHFCNVDNPMKVIGLPDLERVVTFLQNRHGLKIFEPPMALRAEHSR